MSRVAKPKKRPRIGDVVEIATKAGAAWAQYINHSAEFGDLVRVIGPIDGVGDPAAIAGRSTQFATFFPLGAACRRGIARILGTAPIPSEWQEFPRFRHALRLDPSSKAPCHWSIWDGQSEWTVAELNEEQRHYPLRVIMNDTLLVDRVLRGWRAEDNV